MKIFNIRLGFATNSSSTHSIVICDKDYRLQTNDEIDRNDGYHWDDFILVSEFSKMDYLKATLNSQLFNLPESIREAVIKDWIGLTDSHVDHQSLIVIPNEFGTDYPSYEFFTDLKDFLKQKDVIIFGGNDNTEYQDPILVDGLRNNNLKKFDLCGIKETKTVCKKDNEYWITFNKETGSKFRFSFHTSQPYTKSSTPELVDLKITDYCPYDCSFCYQNSTVNGKHANHNDLRSIIIALSELKVFEIAIGGGEPTLYPHFSEIIHFCNECGITPNFTTFNTNFLLNNPLIYKLVGAIAYSCTSAKDVQNLLQINKEFLNKITIQIPMGTVERSEFKNIMDITSKNRIGVTLLGYKTTGRGNDFKPIDYSWAVDDILADKYYYVGIDTVFAQQFADKLKNHVDSRLYTLDEGKFSCYIDGVRLVMGPSSFCDEELYENISIDSYDLSKLIKNIYQKY